MVEETRDGIADRVTVDDLQESDRGTWMKEWFETRGQAQQHTRASAILPDDPDGRAIRRRHVERSQRGTAHFAKLHRHAT